MGSFKFILDNSSKKHICPQCGKKRFVQYLDIETKEYLPTEFGKCDREINCGYFSNPYKEGYLKNEGNKVTANYSSNSFLQRTMVKQTIEFLIPENVLLHTLKGYESNNFIKYISTKFNVELITKKVEDYLLGSVNKFTSFAYINKDFKCKAIALIEYDSHCKRIKTEPQPRNLHTFLNKEYKSKNKPQPKWLTDYNSNESKFNCLYGEHLINKVGNTTKPIAVVEAPKTAFIASMVYDAYVWVAAGALSYLTYERIKTIQQREVYLFPDTSTDGKAFNLWNDKAKQYGFTCIDLLEAIATDEERKAGYDLADYLLEYEIGPIATKTIKPTEIKINKLEIDSIEEPKPILKEVQKEKELFIQTPLQNTKGIDWENEVTDLESYFKNKVFTKQSIKLSCHSNITNISTFVHTHLSIIKRNVGNKTFLPYLERLQNLKTIFTSH